MTSNKRRIPAYDSDAELPLLSKTIGEIPLALFLSFFFSSKRNHKNKGYQQAKLRLKSDMTGK